MLIFSQNFLKNTKKFKKLKKKYKKMIPETLNPWKDKRNGDVCLSELEHVKVPTLIIHGDKDPMVGVHLAKEIENVLIKNGTPARVL